MGDVLGQFRLALECMPSRGLRITGVSRAYRTTALLAPGDAGSAPDYWNAVCRLETRLNPDALLAILLGLEKQAGRARVGRWTPRPLDLDILMYDARQREHDGLTLPHPGLRARLFVLRPLHDLAPELAIPPDGQSVAALLASHPDPEAGILEVRDNWQHVSALPSPG